MNRRVWSTLEYIFAGALMLALPFTSFPLVAKLTGSSMVAPLSLLPLVALMAVWWVPALLKGERLAPQSTPLLALVMVALLSFAGSFFIDIPPHKSASILRGALEAFATLGVGLCFYLVLSGWARRTDRQGFLLALLNLSGLLVLVWSFGQVLIWKLMDYYPQWMWDFQAQVSTSLLLYVNRATGFAYEPSWLAHQLNMIYLPYWLAATVRGYTAYRWRLWKISAENVLLLGGIGALLLSVSRIGLLSFLVMAAVLILWGNIRLVDWAQRRFAGRYLREDRRTRSSRAWFFAASVPVLLILYLALAAGIAYGLSRFDPRMARLFDFDALREGSIMHYANQLVFAERLVFWQTGWEVFNDYPLLGVGPGNAGFFFNQKLSAFGWALEELRALMYDWTALPNIKSLWVRLLAETGALGFGCFAAWVYLLWKSARLLVTCSERLPRTVGMMGILALAGLVIEGFSIDTFALPYFWVTFGLLTACTELVRTGRGIEAIGGTVSDGS